MAIIYLYISLFLRVKEIFQNHTRNTVPGVNAMGLITTYELFIFMDFFIYSFINTKFLIGLFLLGLFIIIPVGNYYIFEKLIWKITIPNNKIYKSKALLNTLFIMLTIWFVYSFFSILQNKPIKKEEIKYYQPLPPDDPKIDTGIERYYNN